MKISKSSPGADLYHALYPTSNFYNISQDRQRLYEEAAKALLSKYK